MALKLVYILINNITFQISQSTPPKSTSTQTLVPSLTPSMDRSPRSSSQTPHRPSLPSPRSLLVLEGATSTPRPIPGVESYPLTVLTPPEGGKRRVPSGEAGYVIMSPGVSLNPEEYIHEEPASLAALEESLGQYSVHSIKFMEFKEYIDYMHFVHRVHTWVVGTLHTCIKVNKFKGYISCIFFFEFKEYIQYVYIYT